MDELIANPDLPTVEVVAKKNVGEQLRMAREVKGLSVTDVAAQIRLAPRQIEALEADDMASLPELPFVRGFVRSYAKLLGLDAQPLLAVLPDPYASSELHLPASVDVAFDVKKLSMQQSRVWLIALAIVVFLVVIFVSWNPVAPVSQPVPVLAVVEQTIELPIIVEPAPASSAPIDAVDALATALVAPIAAQVKAPLPMSDVPALTAPLRNLAVASGVPVSNVAISLRLIFAAESWAEITDGSGKTLSSRHHPAGTELNLKSVGPYQLVIGNASSVQLYRRGKLLDLTSFINKTSDVARLTVE